MVCRSRYLLAKLVLGNLQEGPQITSVHLFAKSVACSFISPLLQEVWWHKTNFDCKTQ
jgi:hypothetical protein